MKAGEVGAPPYTATCDKPWYSERQHAELRAIPRDTLPSPSDRLYIRTIKHGPTSHNSLLSRGQTDRRAVSSWQALMHWLPLSSTTNCLLARQKIHHSQIGASMESQSRKRSTAQNQGLFRLRFTHPPPPEPLHWERAWEEGPVSTLIWRCK